MRRSADSSFPNIIIANDKDNALMVFSWTVSYAYYKISVTTSCEFDPAITKPIANPDASPVMAELVYKTDFN